MNDKVIGNGARTFLQMADAITTSDSAHNDTVRYTKDKGVYEHSGITAIYAGLKDLLRGADSQHLQDREKKVKDGAQKMFDAMRRDYGDIAAKIAIKAVGAAIGGDNNADFQVTRLTHGQLQDLVFMAGMMERHFNAEYSGENILYMMAAGKLGSFDIEPENNAPVPDDVQHDFKEQAKLIFANFAKTGATREVNLNYQNRQALTALAGRNGENIDNWTVDQMISFRDLIAGPCMDNISNIINPGGTRFKYTEVGKMNPTIANMAYTWVNAGMMDDMGYEMPNGQMLSNDELRLAGLVD